MYSDAEIDEAVKAGALAPEAAAALRAHVARQRSAPVGDEEHFRLVTSFNDIFVTAAAILVLAGVGWIAASPDPALGGAGVAAVSWGLAEYFTRRRRMALPSIVLLLAFAGSIFWTVWALPPGSGDMTAPGQAAAMAGVAAAGAAWLHWRRFRVPVTVAAGAAALVVAILCLVFDRTPGRHVADAVLTAMFLSGAGIFALAMRWDLSDRDRETRRSDVAFWLHLLAAPLLVHPVFSLTGDGAGALASAAVVAILYAVLGAVALAIDRRALLVAALFYLLAAVYGLVREFGALNLRLAVTVLIVGAGLLLLSAFWRSTRTAVLRRLPAAWRDRLPPSPEAG